MDLGISDKLKPILEEVKNFIDIEITPLEMEYHQEVAKGDRWTFTDRQTEILETLKAKAKSRNLWNFFLTHWEGGYGLSTVEYAYIAEETGRSFLAPEVFNCAAPDTGNMEVLARYCTEEQKEKWLQPLLAGDIRSSYAMTEPQVASSDATNVEMSIVKDGDEWVLNGRKWFITGAMNERTRILIVMGKSDPSNPNRHLQQTQVLVPKETAGLTLVRPLTTFGYDDAPIGHAELVFENCRVPLENVLLGEGRGFEIAQGRLGPGRMHHCMRLIGTGQRSLELACQRSVSRTTFGRPLSKHQSVREDISRMFSEIEMARLLVLKTCHKIDERGVSASVDMIAATKTTVPVVMQSVIDRAIQMHGAGGLTEDYCMAEGYNYARWCRQADGPDQVHQMALGKQIIERYSGEKA